MRSTRASRPGGRSAVGCQVLMLALLASACDGASDRAHLSVFAAASLTDAFRDLEADFERINPGVDVAVNYAGSQVLRLQIEQGARPDVFASANPAHMDALSRAGLVHDRLVFARNELVLITPADNPAGLQTLADLPRARRVVIGNPNVPVGAYTRAMLTRADETWGPAFAERVAGRVVSEETNVRLVRAKVELGEADAAVVYRTDAAGCDRIRVIPIPAAVNVRAEYHIASGSGARGTGLAGRWIDHLTSPAGRRILERHGFDVGR